jgi:hypothetical protein
MRVRGISKLFIDDDGRQEVRTIHYQR